MLFLFIEIQLDHHYDNSAGIRYRLRFYILYPGTWYVEKCDRQYSNITRSCNNKRQLHQYIQAFYMPLTTKVDGHGGIDAAHIHINVFGFCSLLMHTCMYIHIAIDHILGYKPVRRSIPVITVYTHIIQLLYVMKVGSLQCFKSDVATHCPI